MDVGSGDTHQRNERNAPESGPSNPSLPPLPLPPPLPSLSEHASKSLTQRSTDRNPSVRHAGEILKSVGSEIAQASGGVRSLYIHVPFCFHKCHYCDFYSLVDTRDRQESFTARLCRELAAFGAWERATNHVGALKTIFVGGGTPSLLAVPLWGRVLETLAREFDLSEIQSGRGEFTVECNPETVTPALMETLRGGGVNRVSVGAQSFNETHLKTLERWHDPANVPRAIDMARSAGISRQSVDLIFGIPGQSVEDWRSDLRTALSLGTRHVSCYNLTYEPNTAMTARLKRGEFTPADEDVEVEMFGVTRDTLRGAGLERYEISNFSAPGEESQHNLAYWRQEQWLAAGPSASAHVGGNRWKNSPRLDDYLNGDTEGFSPVIDHEGPDESRAVREFVMTGIRLSEGLAWDPLLERAETVSPGANHRLERTHAKLCAQGWIERDAGRVRLTEAGVLMANRVAEALMDAAVDTAVDSAVNTA
jgi:oxygen-independent coproporphyrinogen III oxidase